MDARLLTRSLQAHARTAPSVRLVRKLARRCFDPSRTHRTREGTRSIAEVQSLHQPLTGRQAGSRDHGVPVIESIALIQQLPLERQQHTTSVT